MAILRILFLTGALIGIYFLIKKFMPVSAFKNCERCEGKGFWYAARGKRSATGAKAQANCQGSNQETLLYWKSINY